MSKKNDANKEKENNLAMIVNGTGYGSSTQVSAIKKWSSEAIKEKEVKGVWQWPVDVTCWIFTRLKADEDVYTWLRLQATSRAFNVLSLAVLGKTRVTTHCMLTHIAEWRRKQEVEHRGMRGWANWKFLQEALTFSMGPHSVIHDEPRRVAPRKFKRFQIPPRVKYKDETYILRERFEEFEHNLSDYRRQRLRAGMRRTLDHDTRHVINY